MDKLKHWVKNVGLKPTSVAI